jgi:uncharacterized Zn finger protein
VPARSPGQDNAEDFIERFRITHMMESLARQSGDIEELIAVMSKDLSVAYHFLQIAEAYKKAGKPEKALEWTDRGVQAFPEHTDSRLTDFLAEQYHRLERHNEAMALIWTEFVESPFLEEYRKLKSHADRALEWQTWREKALAHIRAVTAKETGEVRKKRFAREDAPDHSTLVRIFLWEKDVEAAWAEAMEGGCSESLWRELASKREADHPEDALPIYQRQIEPTVERKHIEAYREAVRDLKKVRDLMLRLGRMKDFDAYLAEVRIAHKAKRNFMKLLEQVKWR